MICPDCRKVGNDARRVLNMGFTAPMGSLHVVLRGHGKCRGGTWCDCKHEMTADAHRSAVPVMLTPGEVVISGWREEPA